jgi:ribosome-binding protein aMBF1 (putative translation factor)
MPKLNSQLVEPPPRCSIAALPINKSGSELIRKKRRAISSRSVRQPEELRERAERLLGILEAGLLQDDSAFGRVLKDAFETFDLSVLEFAGALGYTKTNVYKWLRGDVVPHKSQRSLIAEALEQRITAAMQGIKSGEV